MPSRRSERCGAEGFGSHHRGCFLCSPSRGSCAACFQSFYFVSASTRLLVATFHLTLARSLLLLSTPVTPAACKLHVWVPLALHPRSSASLRRVLSPATLPQVTTPHTQEQGATRTEAALPTATPVQLPRSHHGMALAHKPAPSAPGGGLFSCQGLPLSLARGHHTGRQLGATGCPGLGTSVEGGEGGGLVGRRCWHQSLRPGPRE